MSLRSYESIGIIRSARKKKKKKKRKRQKRKRKRKKKKERERRIISRIRASNSIDRPRSRE